MGEGTGGFNRPVDSFERWALGFRIRVEEDDGAGILHFRGDFGRQLMHSAHCHAAEEIGDVVRYAVIGAQPIADRDN